MPINILKLNQKGKLTHMVARDLFMPSAKQIFNAQTGKFVGMVIDGTTTLFNEQTEPETKPQACNKSNQLNLFD